MSALPQSRTVPEGISVLIRERLKTWAVLAFSWAVFGVLIASWIWGIFRDWELSAIVGFNALLFIGWCVREVWKRPGIYWPRVWRLFQGEPFVWDESKGRWCGKWSYQQKPPEKSISLAPAGRSTHSGERWIPNPKQWLVIWISAILGALMILASAADALPSEAFAAIVPFGLGALGLWHLETRRKN